MKRVLDMARGVTGGRRSQQVRRGAPEIGAAALREAAARLDAVRRAGWSRAARPLAREIEIGVSRSGRSIDHVYLPTDRFEWRGRVPPGSGPITAQLGFDAEFASGLATVTGFRPPADVPARAVSWDRVVGGLPQDLGEAGFAVRRSPGASEPRLQELAVSTRPGQIDPA